MNNGCKSAVLVTAMIFAMASSAQVYQCKDEKGQTAFTDRPCTGNLQQASGAIQDTGGSITAGDVFMVEQQYKVQVATMLNRLAREHGQCKERIAPETAGASSEYSVSGNPSFFVHCGNRQVPTVVRFTLRDIEGRVSIAAPIQIERLAAIKRCEQEARSRAHRPDSVDFSRILDLAFNARPNGETTVLSSFTAENAFGVENKFDIRCDFSGKQLKDVSIARTP